MTILVLWEVLAFVVHGCAASVQADRFMEVPGRAIGIPGYPIRDEY
jgi:hypothetical protein